MEEARGFVGRNYEARGSLSELVLLIPGRCGPGFQLRRSRKRGIEILDRGENAAQSFFGLSLSIRILGASRFDCIGDVAESFGGDERDARDERPSDNLWDDSEEVRDDPHDLGDLGRVSRLSRSSASSRSSHGSRSTNASLYDGSHGSGRSSGSESSLGLRINRLVAIRAIHGKRWSREVILAKRATDDQGFAFAFPASICVRASYNCANAAAASER